MARCLLMVEADKRALLCDKVFMHAHTGDKYRKRFERIHHTFGSGSLVSACGDLPRKPEPFLSNKEYAHCLRVVFNRILSPEVGLS